MKIIRTEIPDILILQPDVFRDIRGFFFESWNERVFQEATSSNVRMVQDNHSLSKKGVLRGIHYQIQAAQAKLVRVVRGRVLDVAVDLRRSSATFRRWVAVELSEDDFLQLWIPAGFGHAFFTLSDEAEVLYKASDYYAPQHERCILWSDPAVGISWPAGLEPILSEKDRRGSTLDSADLFP